MNEKFMISRCGDGLNPSARLTGLAMIAPHSFKHLILAIVTVSGLATPLAAMDLRPPAEGSAWKLAVGLGTFPTCLFSDSGLGAEGTLGARTLCDYNGLLTARYAPIGLYATIQRHFFSGTRTESHFGEAGWSINRTLEADLFGLGYEYPLGLSSDHPLIWVGIDAGFFQGRAEHRASIETSSITTDTHQVIRSRNHGWYAQLQGHTMLTQSEAGMLVGRLSLITLRTNQTSHKDAESDPILGLPAISLLWQIDL